MIRPFNMCSPERLAHIHRPEGCTFLHPYSPQIQKVYALFLSEHAVSVQPSAIRLLPGSAYLSQVHGNGAGASVQSGRWILFYLDDLLIVARSKEESALHTAELVAHLSRLGLAVNWE